MERLWYLPAAALALAASGTAHACVISARLVYEDVKYADVVLLGRVSNYRIVRDVEFRRKMLSNPKLSAELRKLYEGPASLMSDYARFDIAVDKVLVGAAPSTVSVTWDNSTFGEPEDMAAGPFLIALRQIRSTMPPLRGPSATILPNREPALMRVLQAHCFRLFMFESDSEDARAVLAILNALRL